MDSIKREEIEDELITLMAHFNHIEHFPMIDSFGLDPEDEPICDAIVSLFLGNRAWEIHGCNSAPLGRVQAMVEYGIVDINRIKDAMRTYTSRGPQSEPVA